MRRKVVEASSLRRVLYFGSREWIDVDPERGYLGTHTYVRFYDSLPVRGPRFAVVAERVVRDRARGVFVLVEGEADGADTLARIAGREAGAVVDAYPADAHVDGPWPGAGPKRNERMLLDGKPDEGAGFVVGKIDSPYTPGSRSMAGLLWSAVVPFSVYRDDGVEEWAVVEDVVPRRLVRTVRMYKS